MDALQRCLSTHDIARTLEQFPGKIEDVYHTTWKRIMSQDAHQAVFAQAALLWMLHALRPLSIQTLCHAIATCPTTHRFEHDRIVPESTIMDLCQGLLIIDEKSRCVRLVRKSFLHPLIAQSH